MYSDTHFHFQHFTEWHNIDGAPVLEEMAKNKCFFGLDIGTESNDLLPRQACMDKAIARIKDSNLADKVRNFIYFAAGIWPSIEEIKDRHNSMKTLKAQIEQANNSNDNDTLHRKVIAIGECGLDHHWNPTGVDGRNEADFDQAMYVAEKELFEMQLEYAKELKLPVIIHSRDAFQDTLDSIKNVGYDNGIIHCYSYGIEEAKAFLERGWYISFAGGVTYTKKNKLEQMYQLVKSIPDDRLLTETDSPFLAPVPLRGTPNVPTNVLHTYNFLANIRGTTAEELSTLIDQNIKTLFNLTV